MKQVNLIKISLLIALSFILVACLDGDDSSDNSSDESHSTISGTAATGAPMAIASITIQGSAGSTATGTSDNNGNYSVIVDSLTAPFIIQAVPSGGSMADAQYSYAAAVNVVANITPMTTMALFMANSNTDPATAYSNWKTTPIDRSKIIEAQAVINANLTTYLEAEGLDAETYDFLTTAFNADTTGIDAVLETLTFNLDFTNATLDIKEGTTAVTFIVDINTSSSNIGGTPTTDGTGNTDCTLGTNDAACVVLDGTTLTMESASGVTGSDSSASLFILTFTPVDVTSTPSLIISYDTSTTSGTIDCTGSTSITVNDGNGSYSAIENLASLGASCSLTLTSVGTADGDTVSGSFTATFPDGHTASGKFTTVLPTNYESNNTGGNTCTEDGLTTGTACIVIGESVFTIPVGKAYTASGAMNLIFTQDGIARAPSLTIKYVESTTSTAVCTVQNTATTGISFTDDASNNYIVAMATGSSCNITLTSASTTLGELISGAFTASIYNFDSKTNTAITGAFKVNVTGL